jgi:diguanylate cyclase (GGDEF)-like protein
MNDDCRFAELNHIRRLLRDNAIPKLEGELAENPLLKEIHADIKAIRETILSYSAGDFSPVIKARGIIPGCLKALQSHLRHMIWQVQLVEKGDLTQEVHFMGEFSTAFNSMVRQLNKTLTELREKEEALLALTSELQNEVDFRTSAVEALQEREAHFKYLASYDALTGVFNRRSFLETAAAKLGKPVRNKAGCCMAIMDIDHFKQFNDTYGHLAGDEALRHVVRVVSGGLRKNDFLGRYGGEEFTFFFYNADEKTGAAIAERLRQALELTPVKLVQLSAPLDGGMPFTEQEIAVTASFGVVFAAPGEIPKTGASEFVQRMVNNADIALYKAKRSGRNRVVLYRPELAVEFTGCRGPHTAAAEALPAGA